VTWWGIVSFHHVYEEANGVAVLPNLAALGAVNARRASRFVPRVLLAREERLHDRSTSFLAPGSAVRESLSGRHTANIR
jgi:hypothetical protein